MSEKKRMWVMLIAVGILIVANLFVYLPGDRFDASALFGEDTDLAYSARLERVIADMERLPRLDFTPSARSEAIDTVNQRNPFIFGVDRRLQEQRRQRMEELQKQRQMMEARAIAAQQEAAQPEEDQITFGGRLIGIMRDSSGNDGMVSIAYNGQIYILKVGEMLPEGFKLVALNSERVLFIHVDSGERFNIDIDKE
jgi:hypothetical protein